MNMKKFENRILRFPMTKKNSLQVMQDALNDAGVEGWEVVSVTESEFANVGFTAFLKRQTMGTDDAVSNQ